MYSQSITAAASDTGRHSTRKLVTTSSVLAPSMGDLKVNIN